MLTYRKVIFISLLFFVLCLACAQKEKNLDNLMDELISMGYTGKFEKPEGRIEKAAISLFGVDDYLAFQGDENDFVVISFKSEDKVITEERIESLLKMVEVKATDSDRDTYQITSENWKDHVYQNKNYLLAWSKQKPEEIVKLLEKY